MILIVYFLLKESVKEYISQRFRNLRRGTQPLTGHKKTMQAASTSKEPDVSSNKNTVQPIILHNYR